MKRSSMAVAFGASLILASFIAFAQNPPTVPRGNADNGKTLFSKIGCYQCHGRQAQGATATGPRLGPDPIPYNRFLTYIRKPTGDMPPYTAKVVPDQQAADIY